MPELPRPALLDGSFQAHLLHDRARLDAYARAIAQVVGEGDVVADVGSGTGVLAHLALKAGARKVFAVELNTYSYKTLLRAVREHGLTGRVVPVLADGETWRPPEGVDVLVCELMETGLLHEPIVSVCRNAHRGWDVKPRAFLPEGADLFTDGVQLPDEFHGYRVIPPGFRATGSGEALTGAHLYARVDFREEDLPEGVDADFQLTATAEGEIHALRLRTSTRLAGDVLHDESPAYCSPVVLPLDQPIRVEPGRVLEGYLRYRFDYDKEPIRYELRPS